MEGLDKMAQLRIYWKNGGSIPGLVRYQKEEKYTEKMEEEKYSSATEMVAWEKKHKKANGKWGFIDIVIINFCHIRNTSIKKRI